MPKLDNHKVARLRRGHHGVEAAVAREAARRAARDGRVDDLQAGEVREGRTPAHGAVVITRWNHCRVAGHEDAGGGGAAGVRGGGGGEGRQGEEGCEEGVHDGWRCSWCLA